ncbi:MAG: phosphoglycolate phosphatase [Rhizobacter sp.]|nr:phosphoglycolate phosphatase [Rhizobacter sp.]
MDRPAVARVPTVDSPLKALLFDLDGTLIDSAPDLAGACNEMRVERGLEPLPYSDLRRMVGSGARGMVGTAFGVAPGDAGYEALRDEFLARYEARMTRETRVFDAMVPVLAWLAAQHIRWGIVTNKATRFAAPLVASLGLAEAASTLVCGDTVAHAKPHPAPLLEAATRLRLAPGRCVYVGDDRRDVDAGRAAAMATIVATWGYLGAGDAPEAWGADHLIERPDELPALIGSQAAQGDAAG